MNIGLGKCPFCQSSSYSRDSQDWFDDTCKRVCICHDCGGDFVEYFQLDEVKFIENDEEFIYNNSLIKEEKETLLLALNLLVDEEGDTKDYTRIYNILNEGLNRE